MLCIPICCVYLLAGVELFVSLSCNSADGFFYVVCVFVYGLCKVFIFGR